MGIPFAEFKGLFRFGRRSYRVFERFPVGEEAAVYYRAVLKRLPVAVEKIRLG